MQWEVGASSWDQACYAVEKCFKQEKMRPTPKLPFPRDKISSTLFLRLNKDYLPGLAAKVAPFLLLFRKEIEMGMVPWTHTHTGSSLKLTLLPIHPGIEEPLIPEMGLSTDNISVLLLHDNQAKTHTCGICLLNVSWGRENVHHLLQIQPISWAGTGSED